jgi:hypothetical protein
MTPCLQIVMIVFKFSKVIINCGSAILYLINQNNRGIKSTKSCPYSKKPPLKSGATMLFKKSNESFTGFKLFS